MNTDLLDAVKYAITQGGESVLSEPKRISAYLSDLARDVPKPQKNALIKCLEHNFVQTLKNVGNADRANCKRKLAEKLNEEEGLDIVLCGDTIELLATVLFGEENPPAKVTMPSNTFTDPRDGKVYKTVKIGNQVWLAENLAYNAEGSKCYDNNEENGKKYGRLYDWDTAMKSCPSGWHLPSDEEWQELVDFAGGEKIAGKKLKSRSGWNDYEGEPGNGTDDFGFSALPGGNGGSNGSFRNVGIFGGWWSASEDSSYNAYYRGMGYSSEIVARRSIDKSNLFSVRCVKDDDKVTNKTAPPKSANPKLAKEKLQGLSDMISSAAGDEPDDLSRLDEPEPSKATTYASEAQLRHLADVEKKISKVSILRVIGIGFLVLYIIGFIRGIIKCSVN